MSKHHDTKAILVEGMPHVHSYATYSCEVTQVQSRQIRKIARPIFRKVPTLNHRGNCVRDIHHVHSRTTRFNVKRHKYRIVKVGKQQYLPSGKSQHLDTKAASVVNTHQVHPHASYLCKVTGVRNFKE